MIEVLVEGLSYGIMVLGVFITFRIMDFPDLTVEGSFPFGAAIMAAGLTLQWNPWLAVLAAFVGGVLAGCVTAAIHNYLKVPNLLAGIITSTMLYSINLRTMFDQANLQLLKTDTVFSQSLNLLGKFGINNDYGILIFFIVLTVIIKFLVDLFFRTDLGLTIGAMGNNPQVVISAGVDTKTLKFIGLGLSNGLVALSGAMVCQNLGFADASLGLGILVAGLASVLLGEFLYKTSRIGLITLQILLGSILFRIIMYLARVFGFKIGFNPSDNRLLTGLMIIVVLAIPFIQKRLPKKNPQSKANSPKDGRHA